ncbi:MAG: alpha-hydroxy-acid oxidizing protein [Turicibacter sp.]|nr:alpha-hydroxy-acid oxidizing protein [Turicibacter sp.]
MERKKSGNSNHITREYFDSILVEMRHIDSDIPDLTFEAFGETFSTPLTTAALSHLNNAHPEGCIELARGAKLANAMMWVGMGEDAELEGIVATGAKTVKIIKPYIKNEEVFRKIRHAEAQGCIAVGIDIDHSFDHRGQYDNVFGLQMNCKSFEEIKAFAKSTDLPFIVKGVMSAEDAKKCLEAGVAGIVVSHHHGIMDYVIPPLVALPQVLEAIAGKIPVFVDCGIESGMDAFKAMAMGATAVSVGRALMLPLKKEGAQGVADKFKEMGEGLSAAMARTGSKDIKSIDPGVLWLGAPYHKFRK